VAQVGATRLEGSAGAGGEASLPREVAQAEKRPLKFLEESSVAEADGQGAITQPAP